MAITDDESLDFDVTATLVNSLPWGAVYGDIGTEHLINNTSGIPGIYSITSELPLHPHACLADPTITLEACMAILYTNLLEPTVEPGAKWD